MARLAAMDCDAWCVSSSRSSVAGRNNSCNPYKYMWTIEKYPAGVTYTTTGTIATSTKFKFNDQTWYLDLYYVCPRFAVSGNYYVRLHLDTPMSGGIIRCRVEHKFHIINRSGREVKQHVGKSDFIDEPMKIDISGGLCEQDFTSQSILCCELKSYFTLHYQVDVAPSNIVEDLNQKLLETGVGADAKFIVRDENGEDTEEQIPVHSAILVVRSPVFQAMFSHDLEEKRTKEVVIVDATTGTVSDMLRFIYTGAIEPPLNFNRALSLLPCADKYDLTRLKEMCEEVLGKGLNNANAAGVLHVALLCKCTQLCNITSKFVVINNQNLEAILTNYGSIEQLPELIYDLKVATDKIEELLKKKHVKDVDADRT